VRTSGPVSCGASNHGACTRSRVSTRSLRLPPGRRRTQKPRACAGSSRGGSAGCSGLADAFRRPLQAVAEPAHGGDADPAPL
jgi:hypothetical protein